MRFKQYINEADDFDSMDLDITKRIMVPNFKKAKSEKDLDKIFNDLMKHGAKWSWANMNKETQKWIDSEFLKLAKKLKIKKGYVFSGKGK